MPIVTAGDVIQVNLNGTLDGQKILNTFFYGASVVSGIPSTHTFAAAVNSTLGAAGALFSKFLQCCPAAYTLVSVDIQDVAPVRYVKDTFTNGTGGTSTLDASTANLAATITRRGDLAKRTNIGSLHIPYPNLDPGVSGGFVSAAMTSNLNALAAQMVLNFVLAGGVGTIVPVLWKRPLATSVVNITQAIPRETLRTMRRRTVGVGK